MFIFIFRLPRACRANAAVGGQIGRQGRICGMISSVVLIAKKPVSLMLIARERCREKETKCGEMSPFQGLVPTLGNILK